MHCRFERSEESRKRNIEQTQQHTPDNPPGPGTLPAGHQPRPRAVRGLQHGAAADADGGDAGGRDVHDHEQLPEQAFTADERVELPYLSVRRRGVLLGTG